MKTHYYQHRLQTAEGINLVDINAVINEQLQASAVKNGIVTVSSAHTTTAVTINEHEERLLEDIREHFLKLAPENLPYRHNDIHLRDCPQDEPENAHSHLIAMTLGASETVPVADGRLQLGQYQSVMLVELDGPRERIVNIQIMGAV